MKEIKNNDNEKKVITPEETETVEATIVVNMADVMQQYQLAIQNTLNYGIFLGREMAKSESVQKEKHAPQVHTDKPAIQASGVIGIADKFSYGAYTNPEAFEKARVFYHPPTTEVSHFNSFDEALDWAYRICSAKNPGKEIPFSYKRNWRILIKNHETEGENT